MFDLDELARLKDLGAWRVKYADGSEVEFALGQQLGAMRGETLTRAMGALAAEEMQQGGTSPIEGMPSRAEMRREAEKLAPGAEGVVAP